MCIFSDPVKNAHNTNAAINDICEVYIKEEPMDDVVTSMSQEKNELIKMEDLIDIKHETLIITDANCSISMVCFHTC